MKLFARDLSKTQAEKKADALSRKGFTAIAKKTFSGWSVWATKKAHWSELKSFASRKLHTKNPLTRKETASVLKMGRRWKKESRYMKSDYMKRWSVGMSDAAYIIAVRFGKAGRARMKKFRENPLSKIAPQGAVLIGERVKAVEYFDKAKALREGLRNPGLPWRHGFKKSTKAPVFGLRDGSVLIKRLPGQPRLWAAQKRRA